MGDWENAGLVSWVMRADWFPITTIIHRFPHTHQRVKTSIVPRPHTDSTDLLTYSLTLTNKVPSFLVFLRFLPFRRGFYIGSLLMKGIERVMFE